MEYIQHILDCIASYRSVWYCIVRQLFTTVPSTTAGRRVSPLSSWSLSRQWRGSYSLRWSTWCQGNAYITTTTTTTTSRQCQSTISTNIKLRTTWTTYIIEIYYNCYWNTENVLCTRKHMKHTGCAPSGHMACSAVTFVLYSMRLRSWKSESLFLSTNPFTS